MRLLVLDIATTTGWASLCDGKLEFGAVSLPKKAKDYADHPWSYVLAAEALAKLLHAKVSEVKPDIIVVEETNGARARFTQKLLEYLHYAFLDGIRRWEATAPQVVYVNTSDWRAAVGCRLSKEDKNQNARLGRHKRKARDKGSKLDKKALGIRGRVTIKHVSIRLANELYKLELKAKDDDVADALLILTAYQRGVPACTGVD